MKGRGGRTQQWQTCFCVIPFFVCAFGAFNQSRKKAISVLREALKECCWAGLKLKYIPGGWELRRGRHLFPSFHFQHGLCSNFPAILLGLEVGNCQCGFSGKLIRVRTWALPGKMPAHYWEWRRAWTSLYIKQCFRVLICRSRLLNCYWRFICFQIKFLQP